MMTMHMKDKVTKMFRRLFTTSLGVITIVGVVAVMTELMLPRVGGTLSTACTPDVTGGIVCDPSVLDPAPVTHEDPQAAGARGEEVWELGERCEPAPGFFLSEVTEGSRTGVGKKHETTRAALVARIHVAGRRLGVAPHLLEGIAWTESRFDPTARSADGLSYGAFQLTHGTAAAMRRHLAGATDGLSLQDEVTLAIGYLRYLSRLFAEPTVLDDRGNTTTAVADCAERWRFTIAAYNAGEGRVAGSQRRAAAAGLDPTRFDNVRPYLPRITRRYVDSVLTFASSQVTSSQMAALSGGAGHVGA